jgi:ATP-binding cassette, subfamily C, bacterial CydD
MRGLDPRLVRRARPVRRLLALDAGLGVVAALLVLGQAVLIARVAADGFAGASLEDVAPALALLALVVVARAVTAWSFEAIGRRAANDVLSSLRRELVARRLHEQPAALDGTASGDVAITAVEGVDALEATFARYLPQLVQAAIVPVAVLVVVAAFDPLSAVVMLLTLPLVPVFMWLVGRYTERRTRERWHARARLATHFLDVVRGLPTLRAFNRADHQAEQIEVVADRYRVATMGTLRVAFLSATVLELSATLGVALVAVTLGVRVVGGGVGLEAALTVLVLAPELYQPLRSLAAQYHASADGLSVSRRLLDLVEAPAEVGGGTRTPPSATLEPVRFEGVSYAYPGRAAPVLRDVDLELWPAETVALVGPSGSGKSTVVSLLLRLTGPTDGRLTVGGIDLARCDPSAWRTQIAWLPQRPTLFRGTVAENIRLGDRDADDDRVRACARLAGADGFVRGLPDGYATLVGDGGRTLSLGQVRRIALARALLRDAPLLVLDEPTADLDPANAEIVEWAIDRFHGRRTVLLVTHRPELAELADRVVALERGRIAERSTPVPA